MTRYEIDKRLKAEAPDQYLTDLIRPLLKRFERLEGDATISAEGVLQIKRELREIYKQARNFQEALSQCRHQLRRLDDIARRDVATRKIAKALVEQGEDKALLEAFRAENIILFPPKEGLK